MKDITKIMVDDFKMRKLKYDFMGYEFDRLKDLSFHHLIVPKRSCKELGLGDGYLYWNGAILVQDTAHEYLHKIEIYDRERFEDITSQMIYINQQKQILYEKLLRINDVLESFEREYAGKRTPNKKEIVKEEYVRRRILKR